MSDSGSELEQRAFEVRVGDIWRAEMGGREVEWRVTWVGKRQLRLYADLGYAWATATATIPRFVAGAALVRR